ncbi:MAG TPA: phosphate regulon transcriptional regulator PhoB [Thiopseudomonas sp.]|nr:phosphate regulon transcriptional regulator PhoB [Thiopseudomonas sp.]
MTGKTVLIVDDEAPIREMLSVALQMAGYQCLEAANAQTAHELIVDHQPDIILLDWMMPEVSGIELARRLKREPTTAEIPIIMLTARGEEDNKIQGLEAGADDYMTKPFSPRELIARLKAVLRRTATAGIDEAIEVQGLRLDPVSQRVSSNGTPLEMGPTEFRLLQFFMAHPERAYTRGQLLDQVWGGNVYVEERTVDVHIRRLRLTLGEKHRHLVQTVRGTGYRFSTKV